MVKQVHVMIVDDDRDLAESLAELIEMHGHKVAIASNGKEALERAREQAFDVTFMDVRMPVMNGVDSFLEIRKLRPDAKVVEGGAMGLLHKPLQQKELLTKLTDVTKPVILLVDDDADFADGLSELLQAEGYQTAIAGTGADALTRVRSGGVGVLILDLRLPVMNGIEVYKRLKAQGNPPPTIIISGDPAMNAETIAALREMQVKDCLAKPVDPNALLATIASLVA